MSHLAENWLLQSGVLFLLAGSVAGLTVGIALMFFPDRLRALSVILNRWVSTRHLDQALERNVSLDPWFYRHCRISGALTLLGACYTLYFFAVSMDRTATVRGLSMHFRRSTYLMEGLLDALVLSALLGALCAVFVGLFLLLRPSMLREIERGANQWWSLRRALKPAEIPRQGIDEYAFKHSQQAGALLVLGSLYVLTILLFWFGH